MGDRKVRTAAEICEEREARVTGRKWSVGNDGRSGARKKEWEGAGQKKNGGL